MLQKGVIYFPCFFTLNKLRKYGGQEEAKKDLFLNI
jgi:hypothetical protein